MKSKFLELCNDHMTRIVSLVHVGVMLDTRELKYKLEEMELGDFQVIIPTLTKRELDNYGDDYTELLTDYDKYGFIAECQFNVPVDFSFKEDGSFSSCTNSCYLYPFYAYAETIEELIGFVIEKDEKYFEEECAKARKKQGIKLIAKEEGEQL